LASKFISQFTRSWPPTASSSLLTLSQIGCMYICRET
jgi:hypothetical protein